MTARKPKPPALPPVLPLVAVPYVSPGQVAALREYCDMFGGEDVEIDEVLDSAVDLFAADTVSDQHAALDRLRSATLALIDERPIDDPIGASVAAPAPDADHFPDAGTMVAGPVAFAGMTALEAFDGIAGALGFVRAELVEPPVCATCHAAARDLCACGDYGGDDEGMEGPVCATCHAATTITPDGVGWHILANDGRLGNGDGRLVVPGEWMVSNGELAICERGMHWCPRLIDCLSYAQGSVICRVEASGTLPADGDHPDKRVSRHRRAVWMLTADDGERVLRVFARQCAIDVAYLWKPPAVVVEWLEAGDEGERAASWAAAWAAVRAAARAASWAAAWAAAGAAAWAAAGAAARAATWAAAGDAAGDASWDASGAAARAATWAAAGDASWDAAGAAARAAARAATWAAAGAAAGAAAWAAAGAAQNDALEHLVLAAHEGRWSDVAVTLPPTWAETRRRAGLDGGAGTGGTAMGASSD